MKCAYHPEANAVGACVDCGRLVCIECKTVLGGKVHCNPCADKLFTGTLASHKASSSNWFRRHLNWTIVIAWLAVWPISFALGYVVGWFDPYAEIISDEALTGLAYLVAIVWLLLMCGWVIRQKSRSLLWLLLLFVPFGWIAFFVLKNRSQEPEQANEVGVRNN